MGISFYDKYKEWIDQPLHVGMGAAPAFFATWLLVTLGVPWYVSIATSIVIVRSIWMLREWWQHRDHKHEPRYWWSKDLFFIDLGVIGGVIGGFFAG